MNDTKEIEETRAHSDVEILEQVPDDLSELFEEVSEYDPMVSALTRRC